MHHIYICIIARSRSQTSIRFSQPRDQRTRKKKRFTIGEYTTELLWHATGQRVPFLWGLNMLKNEGERVFRTKDSPLPRTQSIHQTSFLDTPKRHRKVVTLCQNEYRPNRLGTSKSQLRGFGIKLILALALVLIVHSALRIKFLGDVLNYTVLLAYFGGLFFGAACLSLRYTVERLDFLHR